MKNAKKTPVQVYKLLTEAYSKIMEAHDATVIWPTPAGGGESIHSSIGKAMSSLSLAIDRTSKQ